MDGDQTRKSAPSRAWEVMTMSDPHRNEPAQDEGSGEDRSTVRLDETPTEGATTTGHAGP